MENFLSLVLSILGLAILFAYAKERTKGKYLGHAFKWKPIPGFSKSYTRFQWRPIRGRHEGAAGNKGDKRPD